MSCPDSWYSGWGGTGAKGVEAAGAPQRLQNFAASDNGEPQFLHILVFMPLPFHGKPETYLQYLFH